MALNYVTITETFNDGTGTPLNGTATFTPSAVIRYAGVTQVAPNSPVAAKITNGTLTNALGNPLMLLATDNGGVSVEGLTGFWFWTVSLNVAGGDSDTFSFFLPSSPSSVELYSLANTPTGRVLSGTFTAAYAPTVVPLTFGASIAVNAALGNVFAVTLTASTGTLANPTNPVDGQDFRFRIAQDGVGSRTLAYGTQYDFGVSGAPTLSTGVNKVDVLRFEWNAALSKMAYLGSTLGL